MSVFDASEKYRSEGRSLIILAGKDYGSGSSRDWAAKGPWMLVRFSFHIIISHLLHGRRMVSNFHHETFLYDCCLLYFTSVDK